MVGTSSQSYCLLSIDKEQKQGLGASRLQFLRALHIRPQSSQDCLLLVCEYFMLPPQTFLGHPKKVCAPHVTIIIDTAALLTHNDTALGAGLYHHDMASCLKTGSIYLKNLYIRSSLPVPSVWWLLKTYLLVTR